MRVKQGRTGLVLAAAVALIASGLVGVAASRVEAQADRPGSLGAYRKIKKDACAIARVGKARAEADDADDGPDDFSGPWQRFAECLKPLRKTWYKQGAQAMVTGLDGRAIPVTDAVRELIAGTLRGDDAAGATAGAPDRYVPLARLLGPDLTPREPIVRIAQLNALRQPYNAMSQIGIARVLSALAAKAGEGGYPRAGQDAGLYRLFATATIRTVVTPVGQGGLATISPCDRAPALRCAWYNAVTNRDRPTEAGGTLNKSLQATRDLLLIAASGNDRAGDDKTGIDYHGAAEHGLNQLFLSAGHIARGAAPNLADFLATPRARDGSWAYYGLDPTRPAPTTGYMLPKPGKNCRYHYRALNELAVILQEMERSGLAPAARAKAFACDSPLRRMYAVTQLPTARANQLAGGQGDWCESGIAARYTPMLAYYGQRFAACPA